MARSPAQDWLAVAEDDLRQVRNNLFGPEPTATGAAYHCQQAVEKLIKAVLVAEGIDFPRSHDLDALVKRLPDQHPLLAVFAPLVDLTIYATAYRYPREDEGIEPTVEAVRLWLDQITGAKTIMIAWLDR